MGYQKAQAGVWEDEAAMQIDPARIERLRAALLAARSRIARNAKLQLFVSWGSAPLSSSDRETRRLAALGLADELGAFADGRAPETLEYRQLSAIYQRIRAVGLALSGPELLELDAAFFAARSDFAA